MHEVAHSYETHGSRIITRYRARNGGLGVVLALTLAACSGPDLAPTLQTMPGQYVATGKDLVVSLPVSDEDLATVQFTFASSDEALVPAAGVTVVGIPTHPALRLSTAAVGTGTAQVTVTATDAGGQSAQTAVDVRVVGPFVQQYPTLVAADAESLDEFGTSFAVSQGPALPPQVLVGAPGAGTAAGDRGGAVYVFAPSGNDMVQVQVLTASDGLADWEFGTSLAADGSVLVVGVPDANVLGFSAGVAYVFERQGGMWHETAKLLASDGEFLDNFGFSVAVSGDVIVIGARWEATLGVNAGAAYVFERDGTDWLETAKLLASDGAADDYFGQSVATDGDTILVAAPNQDEVAVDAGAVYVFAHQAGVWQEVDKVVASDAEAAEYFGTAVAMTAEHAVVGAYGESDVGPNGGAAYVLERAGDTFVESEKLIASDSAGVDQFGAAVAIHDTTLIVGAYREDDQAPNAGAVYVFDLQAGVWQELTKLYANDGAQEDLLGQALALGPNLIVMGTNYSDGAGDDAGSAYVVVW